MKIVAYSNFGIEIVNEWFVAVGIPSNALGEIMVKALQASVKENDTYYYKLVDNDYKLYKWEP